jgi:hypothetical protein
MLAAVAARTLHLESGYDVVGVDYTGALACSVRGLWGSIGKL